MRYTLLKLQIGKGSEKMKWPISAYFGGKLQQLFHCLCTKLYLFHKNSKTIIISSFQSLILQTNPFRLQLFYLLFLSLFGYLSIKITKPTSNKKTVPNYKDIDIFFTSVSAATVSSMATLEMEVFSDSQLLILILLIISGGEIFISILTLQFQRLKLYTLLNSKNPNSNSLQLSANSSELLENDDLENNNNNSTSHDHHSLNILKLEAFKSLSFVGLGYLLVVQTCGYLLTIMYIYLVPSISNLLAQKEINLRTFSMFITVSTFSNCGFIPTNENMTIFKKNSGLLLLLIPQILLGNSLYAPCLRFLIWVLEKLTNRDDYRYLLRNNNNNNNNNNNCDHLGYTHLMPRVRSWFIVLTAFGFIVIQFIVFCFLEWKNSTLMEGLDGGYEKIVAVVFQVVNTRHTGESVFDLSSMSPSILVIFIVLMYLPPYTSYMPILYKGEEIERSGKEIRENKKVVDRVLFSQLSYLVLFIVLICVVEAEKLKKDPLNFNVLNITIEVISAYGNVGFSTGYSCERQIEAEIGCKNEWIGFVGKWSNSGKFILILVMFFGKLKKFNQNAGHAWKLS